MTEFINEEGMEAAEEAALEYSASHWAEKASRALEQSGAEAEPADALKALASLDAEYGITTDLDAEELDVFLDNFEDAVQEFGKKQEVMEEHIEEAEDAPKE